MVPNLESLVISSCAVDFKSIYSAVDLSLARLLTDRAIPLFDIRVPRFGEKQWSFPKCFGRIQQIQWLKIFVIKGVWISHLLC